jgi:hypothetical protein
MVGYVTTATTYQIHEPLHSDAGTFLLVWKVEFFSNGVPLISLHSIALEGAVYWLTDPLFLYLTTKHIYPILDCRHHVVATTALHRR